MNRLKLTNAFDENQSTEVTFQRCDQLVFPHRLLTYRRHASSVDQAPLSNAEVKLIEDALERSQHGGMRRVLALIRARGKEIVPQKKDRVTWRSGGPPVDSSDNGSDSGSLSSGESFSEAAVVESNTYSVSGQESVDTSEPPAAPADEAVSETVESESSSSVSSDRRSYY